MTTSKYAIIVLLFVAGCGLGDRSSTENYVNVNCNTNIFTSTVPSSKVAEKLATLEDAGADVLRLDDLPGGDVAITYSVEQCNSNGNIDQSEAGDTNVETNDE